MRQQEWRGSSMAAALQGSSNKPRAARLAVGADSGSGWAG